MSRMTTGYNGSWVEELARIGGSCALSALLNTFSGDRVTLLPSPRRVWAPSLPPPPPPSPSPPPPPTPALPLPSTDSTTTKSDNEPASVGVTEAEVVRPPARPPAKRLLPGEPPGPWKYSWAQGDNRTDLVARGTLKHRGQSYVALEILLDSVVLARAAITPTCNLFSYQKVGMRLPAVGELESRCDQIKFDFSRENWGPRVDAGALEGLRTKDRVPASCPQSAEARRVVPPAKIVGDARRSEECLSEPRRRLFSFCASHCAS